MPIRLNVGVSKKVGLPAYGSAGATCNLELELDAHLLENDPDGFRRRVRSAYLACRQSVRDELARQQDPPAAPAETDGHRHGTPRSNGATVSRPEGSSSRHAKFATPSQVRAITTIARGRRADLDGLLRGYDASRPEELTVQQASALIDRLKDATGV